MYSFPGIKLATPGTLNLIFCWNIISVAIYPDVQLIYSVLSNNVNFNLSRFTLSNNYYYHLR